MGLVRNKIENYFERKLLQCSYTERSVKCRVTIIVYYPGLFTNSNQVRYVCVCVAGWRGGGGGGVKKNTSECKMNN